MTINASTSVTATFKADSESPISLEAAISPGSRSMQVGTSVTALATITNVGLDMALGCGLSPIASLTADFNFQTTDPVTNQVTGTANTPVDIPVGAAQSFVFTFTPTGPTAPSDIPFTFDCTNTDPALINPGVNTLSFSASDTPTPDIVAMAATLTTDGIVNIPGANGTGVFSVATENMGVGGTITASADTGGVNLPVGISICEMDPITETCLLSTAESVTTTMDANEAPTFGVFVEGTGNVSFDPATNRIFVRFRDSAGVTRGLTSVAVKTE